MNEISPLNTPFLSIYAYFGDETIAHKWHKKLNEHLKQSSDPDYVCRIYHRHDVWVAYASISLGDTHTPEAWKNLSVDMFGENGTQWTDINQTIIGNDWLTQFGSYLGVTLFFGAEVTDTDFQHQKEWLVHVPLLPESKPTKPNILSQPTWSHIWQLAGQPKGQPDTMHKYPHVYVVLFTPDQKKEAYSIFFRKGNMDILELSLHKSHQHLQNYEHGQGNLHRWIDNLDSQLTPLLHSPEPSQTKLQNFSKEYADFATAISVAAELQNSVHINTLNARQRIEEFSFTPTNDVIYHTHLKQIEHGLTQLEVDKVYYEAAMQRLDTGLQTVRTHLETIQNQRNLRIEWLLGIIGVILGVVGVLPFLEERIFPLFPDNKLLWIGVLFIIGLLFLWFGERREKNEHR